MNVAAENAKTSEDRIRHLFEYIIRLRYDRVVHIYNDQGESEHFSLHRTQLGHAYTIASGLSTLLLAVPNPA